MMTVALFRCRGCAGTVMPEFSPRPLPPEKIQPIMRQQAPPPKPLTLKAVAALGITGIAGKEKLAGEALVTAKKVEALVCLTCSESSK